ncbi:Gti1/Pac2 family-domain-containing protein [Endogone sp. FLAS-F59071]|nr:Gti1/Pac2 family-domain-containing protein [Endogone sp. FLAS-F59071]|eukprot:RUS13870.1 Gti1/Pac2 family-domain-containing protein [Endogone sp. FLAS-F59071]
MEAFHEACRLNILPRTRRRLLEREKNNLGPGAIYVFDEKESGIKRWTDGRFWSPSRIHGNFLVYREVHKKLPAIKKCGTVPKEDVKEYQKKGYQILSSNKGLFLYKPGGLIKKTISICVNDAFQHMICYETEEAKASGRFHVPTDCLELRDLQLLPSLLAQQKFRKPEHVQASGSSNRKRRSPERDGDQRSVSSSSSEGSSLPSQSSSRESSPLSKREEEEEEDAVEAANGEGEFRKIKVKDQQPMLKYSTPFISEIRDPMHTDQAEPSSPLSRHWQGELPISQDITSNNINRDYYGGEHSPYTPPPTTTDSSDGSLRVFGRSGWSVTSSSSTVAATPSITDVAENVCYSFDTSCFSNCSTAVQVPTTTIVQNMEAHILTSRELQERTYEVFKPLDFDGSGPRLSQEVLLYPPSSFTAVTAVESQSDSKVQLWDYQGHGLEFWWNHMGGDVVTADQIAETEGDVEIMSLDEQAVHGEQASETVTLERLAVADASNYGHLQHPTTNLKITAETTVAAAEDFDIYTLMGIDKPSYETASTSCTTPPQDTNDCIYIPIVDHVIPFNLHVNPEHLVTAQPSLDMNWSIPGHTEMQTTTNGEHQPFLETQIKNEEHMMCYDGGWEIGSDSSYGMKEGQGCSIWSVSHARFFVP